MVGNTHENKCDIGKYKEPCGQNILRLGCQSKEVILIHNHTLTLLILLVVGIHEGNTHVIELKYLPLLYSNCDKTIIFCN